MSTPPPPSTPPSEQPSTPPTEPPAVPAVPAVPDLVPPNGNRGLLITLVALGVVIAVALVTLIVINVRPTEPAPTAGRTTSETPTDTATPSETEIPSLAEVATRDPDDPRALGDVDAPAVLVYFFDPRCPFCARFDEEYLPTVVSELVDTGQLRVEFRDVGFLGDQSRLSAIATRAAAAQGKYHEFVDEFMSMTYEGTAPDMTTQETLVSLAEAAGVPDLAAFEAALRDPTLGAAVDADTQLALDLESTGVPFFVLGEQSFSGAPALPDFLELLEQEIAAAG